MDLIAYKLAGALLILVISIVAVIHPLRKKRLSKQAESIELGEAFASGIFLGTALFHMLPEAISQFSQLHSVYPLAEVVCAGSFLFMLFLERLSLTHSPIQTKHSIPYIITLILIIHALIEGAALGIGTTLSEVILLFIAIFVHKASERFALCMSLIRSQLPFVRIIIMISIFAVMTPIGIALGNMLTLGDNSTLTAAWFNAIAAGTFLYISTLHHVHFHQHAEDARGMMEFFCLAIGTAAMAVIAVWA